MSSLEFQRFGEKLRVLRSRERMTLKTLAAAIDMCTHSHLSELEAGKKIPTAKVVLKIARTFGVSTDTLMKDELELESDGRRP